MNKSFAKKFVSKVFDEMKETDKQIIKQQQEVEKRIEERKKVIKGGIRIKKISSFSSKSGKMSFDLGNILILKKDGTISPLNKHINRNRYKNNNFNKVS